MTQIQLDWTPRKASAEALESLSVDRLRDDHLAIPAALKDGPKTDEQLLAITGINPNAIRARRGELVTRGDVVKHGEPGTTKSGRRATKWALKIDGFQTREMVR